MQDPLTFTLAAAALLATPGPTNTLLAMTGASAGLRRSLRLVPAELAGYLTSIVTLSLVVGPALAGQPGLQRGLRAASACVLALVALRLWRSAGAARGEPIGPRALFLTTLSNPKALVFTFVIIPHAGTGDLARALPYLAGLAALIAGAACVWIALGATLRAGAPRLVQAGAFRRAGSVVLAGFAAVLSLSLFAG